VNHLLAFLPIDRLHALAHRAELPEWSDGAVLFADVSGFTPLAASLARELGARRGAEELTRQLNAVYEVLIDAVHAQGGSVIAFTGDAITCVFDDARPASGASGSERALLAALGMQQAMASARAAGRRSSLSVRIAAESGRVRRLLVGPRGTHVIDVVAGAAVDRLAVAAHAAAGGEIIAGPRLMDTLAGRLDLAGRRDGAIPLGVVAGMRGPRSTSPWPELCADRLTAEELAPWVLPAVVDRLRIGQTEFLAELRPATALLMKFAGLDYEHDPDAGEKLDQFVQWVQAVVAHAEGSVIDVTTGDKGSCIYSAFGAPVAHEDDARRAVDTAAALARPPASLAFITTVQLGVSRGRMRTGPYGSATRRTYGVLGDETNVAARLMESAPAGTVLVSQAVVDADQRPERFGGRATLVLKGRVDPVAAFAVVDSGAAAPKRRHASELIGRARERAVLARRLDDLAHHGAGGVVMLVGEPGVGKSRLIEELAAMAEGVGVRAIAGAAVAVERSTPYYSWRSILSAVVQGSAAFATPDELRERVIEAAAADPVLFRLSPLLQPFLPVDLPDNEYTVHMSGEVRAENTQDLVVHILSRQSRRSALVLIFEDAHWQDSATWALAKRVSRDVPGVLLVMSMRPMDVLPADAEILAHTGRAETLHLDPLAADDALTLASRRLGAATLSDAVATLIRDKAQGNPFFSEELAYALRDRQLVQIVNGRCEAKEGVDLSAIAFPDTVDGVVMSRIDQLSASQQLTLKLASVIGRTFRLEALAAVHPAADGTGQIEEDLDTLRRLDITPLNGPAREYMFKHVITQEVAYNLLLFRQRRALHRAVAEWHEREHAANLSMFYSLLAHHWGAAQVAGKALDYLERAGDQALANDANDEAARFATSAIAIADAAPAGTDEEPEADPGPIGPERRALWELSLAEARHRIGLLSESEESLRVGLQRLGYPVPDSPARIVGGVLVEVAAQAAWRLVPRASAVRSKADGAPALAHRGYSRLAELSFLHGRPPLVLYGTLRALNLAELMDSQPALALGYAGVCVASGMVPAHRLARYYLRKAAATAEGVTDPAVRAEVLLTSAVYQAGAGDFDEATARLSAAADAFQRFGNFHRWGTCLQTMCRVAWSRGDLDRFIALTDQLHATGRRRDDLRQQIWGLDNRAEYLLMTTNAAEEALALATESLALLTRSREEAAEVIAQGLVALAHARLGHVDSAASRARALTLVSRAGRPTSFGMLCAYASLADVCLSAWESLSESGPAGIEQQARAACLALDRFAVIFPIGRPRAALQRGRRLWLLGRRAAALRHWQRAIAHAEQLGMVFDEALAALELGRHLPASDPRRPALLARARDVFADTRADYELARAARAMA
jgi:class 3 adenylate cyclase/tetratricopeptide (TPR) repeat protein